MQQTSILPSTVAPGPAGNLIQAFELEEKSRDLYALELLDRMIHEVFPGRIALVSSFGAESAVLLDMVAQVNRHIPVIFLETGKHFTETLMYRDRLVRRIGLTDVRDIAPAEEDLEAADPGGTLWKSAPDRCCHIRKVLPLERALEGFDAWITGRKRYQGGTRETLPRIEAGEDRIKVNPLADWSLQEIRNAFKARDLPSHPLTNVGYLSIGCAPCTSPALLEDAPRAGRWNGMEKTECGIHRPNDQRE